MEPLPEFANIDQDELQVLFNKYAAYPNTQYSMKYPIAFPDRQADRKTIESKATPIRVSRNEINSAGDSTQENNGVSYNQDMRVTNFLRLFTRDMRVINKYSNRLTPSEEDIPFFNEYVNMMQYAYRYPMRVTKVFEIDGLQTNPNPACLNKRFLLMHGVHKASLLALLINGFNPNNGMTKHGAMIDQSYVFTDCSTKALNFGSRIDGYMFRYKMDKDKIQPNVNDLGYILICDVALGNLAERDEQVKRESVKDFINSARINSWYKADHYVKIPVKSAYGTSTEDVLMPYGGFVEDMDAQKLSFVTKYSEYGVYDPSQIVMKWLLEVKRVA